MINRKLWLCIYTSLTFLGYINTAKAETNYEALHLNHNIVAKYENGGFGYKAVSKDSYGGYSYGKWQISTKRSKNGLSTFDYFIQYTKNKNIIIYNTLQNAGGYEAAFCGKSIFIDTWKNLANNRNFQILYDNFISLKFLQQKNVSVGISVIPFGILILVKLVQYSNTLLPISVMLFGINKSFLKQLFLKHRSLIVFNPFGKTN